VFCECGCGLDAGLYPMTISAKGILKGQPRRFIHGHHGRLTFVSLTVEQRRENNRLGWSSLTIEQRRERTHRGCFSQTSEQRRKYSCNLRSNNMSGLMGVVFNCRNEKNPWRMMTGYRGTQYSEVHETKLAAAVAYDDFYKATYRDPPNETAGLIVKDKDGQWALGPNYKDPIG
jgi:hypothetical protein